MKLILFPWGKNVWSNIWEEYFTWCMLPIVTTPWVAATKDCPLVLTKYTLFFPRSHTLGIHWHYFSIVTVDDFNNWNSHNLKLTFPMSLHYMLKIMELDFKGILSNMCDSKRQGCKCKMLTLFFAFRFAFASQMSKTPIQYYFIMLKEGLMNES